jgi:uncharacterized protein (DUF924 family)
MRAFYNIQKLEANSKGLRSFYDLVKAYLRGSGFSWKIFNLLYGNLLVCILLDKLPSDVRKSVARQHNQDEYTLEQLRNALKAKLRLMKAGKFFSIPANQPSRQQNSRQSVTMYKGVNNKSLRLHSLGLFCVADHPITRCTNVSSIEERKRIVQEKRLCFNCLSSRHQKKD